jgi:hypothetical protein
MLAVALSEEEKERKERKNKQPFFDLRTGHHRMSKDLKPARGSSL